ncbi:MAG: protein translocase subunit SecF [Patescibacteria group bacterium]
MKLHVVKLRWVWFAASAVMIVGSLFSLGFWGLRQGIDFTGGSLLSVRFSARPTPIELRQSMESAQVNLGSVVIQPAGEQDMQVRLQHISEEEHQKLLTAIQTVYPGAEEMRFDAIGPTVGDELRQKSIQGLLIALLAIMIYVALAFRKVSAPVKSWKYGLVTIFSAFHDVIVPVGVFSILGHFYGWEVGTSFIAAVLTILGYSITDTIVVMDRIRENLHKRSGTFEEIVEASVHQTFLRSFNTSMTTLLVLTAIAIFGGESLREFTLTLIIGIAVGTYSSIFVAAPLLVTWEKWSRDAQKKS